MKTFVIYLAFVFSPALLLSQVSPEWTQLYNGTDDYIDFGVAITLDQTGNVIVGGTSVSITNGAPDYIVIKYNFAGEKQWEQVYNGTGNFEDYLAAITTDQEGNVYVTGGSNEGTSRNDFVTIKYSPSGVFVWKSVYRGLNVDNDDAATDIVTDKNGFVYITGSSAGFSSSLWTDFATIKCNALNGDTIWTRRFGGSGMPNDRATALAVDDYGFVYVTGYTEGDVSQRYNYTTVKYRPNGDTAWVRHYNGTGSDEDRAYAIAVDEDRNIIITGASWGAFYDDYATVKYDSNGVQQWDARYNGPANSYDKAWDIKVESGGSIYVTGESGGSGGNYDYCTIKYNPDGGEEWVARYNGPDNYNDYATALAVDGAGHVHVTGYSENAPSPFISTKDIVTLTYDQNDGFAIGTYRYNGPGNYHDYGIDIAVDQPGNIFVTGKTETYGQQNSSDILTINYAGLEGIKDMDPDPIIRFYPNPASDLVTIRCDKDINRIEVYSVTGSVIFSKNQPVKASGNYELDLTGLPDGLYLVKATIKDYCLISKILLQ